MTERLTEFPQRIDFLQQQCVVATYELLRLWHEGFMPKATYRTPVKTPGWSLEWSTDIDNLNYYFRAGRIVVNAGLTVSEGL